MGGLRKSPPWTDVELERLHQVFPWCFPQELPEFFPGRSIASIRARAMNIEHLTHEPRRVAFVRAFEDLADGNYVSGLVDGEGWFMVSLRTREEDGYRTNFNLKFGMALRLDDRAIFDWLCTYFDCGVVRVSRKRRTSKPQAVFVVADLYNILRSIIPHFDKYPLRAKKRVDYEVWKEMALVSAEYFRLPWDRTVRQRMNSLYRQLRAGRKYRQAA